MTGTNVIAKGIVNFVCLWNGYSEKYGYNVTFLTFNYTTGFKFSLKGKCQS